MCFRNHSVRNTWLDKCLKNPPSEDLLKSNMVNGSKHCCNVINRILIILIDHSEGN